MNSLPILDMPLAVKKAIGSVAFTHSPLMVGLLGLGLAFGISRLLWKQAAAERLVAIVGRLLPLLTWVFIAASVGLFVVNGVFPFFRIYTECQTASTAYLLLKGYPLFHSVDFPERYSVLYGPNTYLLIEGCYRLFGVSVFVTKLPLTLLLLTMAGTVGAIFRRYVSVPSIALSAFFVLLAFEILNCSPIILLSAIVAHAAYYLTNWRGRAVVIGFCIALACNAKIHSGLYFLPIFFDLLFRRRLLEFLVLSFTAAVLMVLPFLLPGINISGYIYWLRAATAHGLSPSVFLSNLDWLAFQFAIYFVVFVLVTPRRAEGMGSETFALRLSPASRAGAALALLGALIIASKPGAGFHHLLPLIPAYVILFGPVVQNWKARAQKAGHGLLLHALSLVFLAWMLIFNLIPLARVYSEFALTPVSALQADLRGIMNRNPGARIVMGDGESAPGEILSRAAAQGKTIEPLLLFAGHPFLYDTAALQDMEYSHIPLPSGTVQRLRDGTIDLWLFPKGRQPFNLMNLYGLKDPMFSPDFRAAFFANYSYEGTSEFYDIWKYHGGAGAPN